LVCVYGRRRLGKSRLLRELRAGGPRVFYVGDERDPPVQRAALAREMDELGLSFSAVSYPGWAELLERFWREAPAGALLILDELPVIVSGSPELPSILQKLIDVPSGRRRRLVLCGSSQRMMHGLVLDATAPLYGRAVEIVRVEPLEIGWLPAAFGVDEAVGTVERWSVWGGVPRYWELARGFASHEKAVRELVLDPGGILHAEPRRLLLDEIEQQARAASLLAVIGQGCHRVSEIAARVGQPATALSRPLARLVNLGFVRREVPFDTPARDAKRSLYRIADPFLRFWFRFVEPNRSRLEALQFGPVEQTMARELPHHLGSVWEDLVRRRISRGTLAGTRWGAAERWWGRDRGGAQLEIDVVARASEDPERLLIAEVKLSLRPGDVERELEALQRRVALVPSLGARRITFALFVLRGLRAPRVRVRNGVAFGPEIVVGGLR
jgi:AAA+ ATPase superfamily predicted ATPase